MKSIMAPQIVDVLIKQCEAGIDRHKINVRVLTEKKSTAPNSAKVSIATKDSPATIAGRAAGSTIL